MGAVLNQAFNRRGEPHAIRHRIVLYSHDTMGLGHMRRNLLIAQALTCPTSQADVLMIAGAQEASDFALPPGVDVLTLPALHKDRDGQYQPRSLGLTLQELVDLRANTIRAALEAFKPDVLIVDNVPRGAVGELNPTLDYLRVHGHTRCVLGLRDVLDDPAVTHREWAIAANEEAIRDHYDAVWVYGDPAVYDPVREYNFSCDIAAKARYTGYLDQRMRLTSWEEGSDPLADLGVPPGQLVFCAVGGGQDGACLAEAFAQAELPPETNGVLLTGPFMPLEVKQRLHRAALQHPRLRILEFIPEPTLLLSRADRVIAMGGYNTVCEVLSFEKRALIVPRVIPRLEQLIRAERLRDLGLIDMLHPDDLTSRTLTAWLTTPADRLRRVRDRIDLNGFARLPHLLAEVLAAPRYLAQPA